MATVKPVSFTDYGAENSAIERRRKLAEAMQAQSMQPIETQSYGGIPAPISWTQGLAKVLQSYAGAKGQREADTQQQALSQRYQAGTGADIQALVRAMGGRPAQTIQPDPQEAAQTADYGTPPVAPVNLPAQSPAESLQAALPNMQTPMGQQMATSYLMEQMKPKELFGKVEPKDYTSESIALFQQTKNPAVLVPRTKFEHFTGAGENGAPVTQFFNPYSPPQGPQPQPVRNEFVNTGGAVQPVNPYSQQGQLPVTVSPNAQLAANTATRGQDLSNARQAEQNVIANANKNISLTESMRKEFANLPEVKNYKDVIPIYNSAKRAPDTPAGDIDVIYAVGKIMDPGSVVREGELTLVIKSGSPAQRFQGLANYVRGGGRLTPAQRNELYSVLDSRVGALQHSYDAARQSYTRMVGSQGIDPQQVFADLPSSVITNPGANTPFSPQDIVDELRRRGAVK